MAGYNRIVVVGNLTRDPDYKQLPSGQGVCRLGLATNRQFKNRQTGAMVQEVCYVDVDVWGSQAESCRQYLQKGRAVLVEGRLKFDSWEDPNGQTRTKHSIVADRVVFLSSADIEAGQGAQTSSIAPAPRRKEPSFSSSAGVSQEHQDALEKDLLNQIDKIKTKAQPKKAALRRDESADGGEISFNDEPPFEDDLPF